MSVHAPPLSETSMTAPSQFTFWLLSNECRWVKERMNESVGLTSSEGEVSWLSDGAEKSIPDQTWLPFVASMRDQIFPVPLVFHAVALGSTSSVTDDAATSSTSMGKNASRFPL